MTKMKKTSPAKNVKKASLPTKSVSKKASPKKAPAPKAAPSTAKQTALKKDLPKKAPHTPVKKSVAQKTAPAKNVKKAVVKKAPAKKTAPTKTASKKAGNASGKKAATPKKVQQVASKSAPKKSAARKVVPAPEPVPPQPKPAASKKPLKPFTKDELASFRFQLQQQLELIQGNLDALANDNLKRSPIESSGDISSHSTHMADHGTDNFDRELALNLASSRQESLYDVEDAIRRVDDGSYGVCESCGGGIERPRLRALPFAKKCVVCQNASERGRTRYRPFGGTLTIQQFAVPADDSSGEGQE